MIGSGLLIIRFEVVQLQLYYIVGTVNVLLKKVESLPLEKVQESTRTNNYRYFDRRQRYLICMSDMLTCLYYYSVVATIGIPFLKKFSKQIIQITYFTLRSSVNTTAYFCFLITETAFAGLFEASHRMGHQRILMLFSAGTASNQTSDKY